MELSLVVLRAADLEVSRRFYEMLGLTLRRERHEGGPEHFSCSLGGVVVELYPKGSGASTEGLRLGFAVADLAGVAGACGSAVIGDYERDGVRVVVVKDPDGHKVELTQSADDRR